jgi:hypothetical protein
MMHERRGAGLTVNVNLLTDPCMWQWEIRDPRRDEVVATSWNNEWMAYESPDEAYRAGQAQLDRLAHP